MSANWDYALMAHEASLHGGPEGYVDSIRQDAFDDGFERGTMLGTAFVTGGLAIIALGKIAWDKYSEYRDRRREEKEKAEEDRRRLIWKLREEELKSSESKSNTE